MKRFLIFLVLLTPLIVRGQVAKQSNDAPIYQMRQYYFVLLTKGPRRGEIKDTAIINRLQEGHMANMSVMAKAGKLLVAGPFTDDGNWRGLFIFNCETREEVEKLLQQDPAIKAGRLAYEIHPWMTAKNEVFK